MPTTPQPPDEAAVVATLRSAGCVFAEDEARLLIVAAQTPAQLRDMIARRTEGLPLEHVVGWAEFRGLRIAVEPGVFVPRPRTALLVEHAAALAPRDAVIVDVCCGSGALGVALAATLDHTDLHASDIDPVAVRCARRNVGPDGHVYEGDLYDPLPGALRNRVDVLLANVPYVPTGEIGLLPREARLHEPPTTLDGGADGLELLRRVADQAPAWLAPGGHLLCEITDRQSADAVDALTRHGLTATTATCVELDATVVVGRRDLPPPR